MAEFYFYQDQLVKVWERREFSIEAKTEEEAIKKAKEIAGTNYQVYEEEDDDVHFYDTETLYETEEPLTPDENKGHFTMEIYLQDDLKEPVARNAKA